MNCDMADVAVVKNIHILTKMRNTWGGDHLTKKPQRIRIRSRSKQIMNVKWRSWQKQLLGNCATVRRREKWSRHDGVTEGKGTHRAAILWSDSSEKERIPVYRRAHRDNLRRELANLNGTIMHTPITEKLLADTQEEATVAKANGSGGA